MSETAPSPAPAATPAAFLDALIDPAGSFTSPAEVAAHPAFTPEQKRTILIAWVNDALALEEAGAQDLTDFAPVSQLDALIEALEACDPALAHEYAGLRRHVRGKLARGAQSARKRRRGR
jgi:hypothetical protein